MQALLSGNSSFIDIRYKLSRPDKIRGQFPIYLIDEMTGERFELIRLTKYGAIRTKHNKYQPKGILLFYNRNGAIKRGSRITLFFGTLITKNIEVG